MPYGMCAWWCVYDTICWGATLASPAASFVHHHHHYHHHPLPTSTSELTHYRGEPDPFKGDVPNQRVREYAKETLDVLFAAQEAPTYTAQAGSNTKGRIQGFGSTAAEPASNHSNVTYGSGGGGGYGGSSGYGASGGGGSSSKYVGFGNPMMEGRNAPPPSAAATVTATFDMAKQWVTSAGQAVGLTVPSKPGGARTMLGEVIVYSDAGVVY